MENIYVWLFLFAGGTIAFLAMLLLGSERELKKKRRELQEIQRNRSDSAVHLSGDAQDSRSSVQDQELLEKIAFLSSRLEESQKVVDGLQAERDQWLSAHADNQRPEETAATLKTQLQVSENRASESGGRAQEMMERNAQLQAEVDELTRQHQASQTTIAELQAGQERIVLDSQSEKQKIVVENQQLQQEIADLRNQLQASETQIGANANQYAELKERHAQTQLDLGELKQRLDHLSEEKNSLSSKLADAQRTLEEMRTMQEGMQSENQHLQATNQELQKEIAKLKLELQASESQLGVARGEHQELADRNAQLQREAGNLREKLQSSQKTLEEFQVAQEQLSGVHFENRKLQQEIVDLRDQLKTGESRLGEAVREVQASADRNGQLQREAAELKQQLESGQRTIEELRTEQERLAGVHLENQKLRQESADLRDQLERSETEFAGLSRQNQEAADHYARLQGEAAALTRQVDEMQPKIRELDALQQELASAESRERILRSRQDDQETQIAALRRDLSAAEGKVQELDAARSRMAEIERRNQELSNENRRLETEISRSNENCRVETEISRERLDGSAENQRQIDALRGQPDESPMKHVPFLDLNDEVARLSRSDSDITRILQSARDAGGALAREPMGSPAANPVEPIPSPMALSQAKSAIPGSGEFQGAPLRRGDAEEEMVVENGQVSAAAPQSWPRKKARMAKIAAVVVLAVAAGAGVGFLGTRYFTSKDDVVEREFVSDERSLPNESASQTGETKPVLRVQGKFKITRATEVYSGPTEKSALITRIEPGMKINVVDARDGWLEIRSKYGRPPGFVREEAAVKIDQN
jgi:predicted  nucleic acid-binding Zn-ribbon protein